MGYTDRELKIIKAALRKLHNIHTTEIAENPDILDDFIKTYQGDLWSDIFDNSCLSNAAHKYITKNINTDKYINKLYVFNESASPARTSFLAITDNEGLYVRGIHIVRNNNKVYFTRVSHYFMEIDDYYRLASEEEHRHFLIMAHDYEVQEQKLLNTQIEQMNTIYALGVANDRSRQG